MKLLLGVAMPVFGWDVRWLLWVNQSRNAVLDWTLSPIARYGYLCWLLLLVVILFLDRRRGTLVFLLGLYAWGFSAYIATLLNPLLKHPRPFSVPGLASQLHLLAAAPSSFSFPSGAATYSFAVAGVIAYFYSGWKRLVSFLAAAIIGYSRVYVGVHFPSDVIGGMLIGLAVGLLGTALESRWWRREYAGSRTATKPAASR